MKLIAVIVASYLVAGCQHAGIIRDLPKYW